MVLGVVVMMSLLVMVKKKRCGGKNGLEEEEDEIVLVRRLVVNKTAEILFNDAIEHLGLPVALGMISCAHAQLGPT